LTAAPGGSVVILKTPADAIAPICPAPSAAALSARGCASARLAESACSAFAAGVAACRAGLAGVCADTAAAITAAARKTKALLAPLALLIGYFAPSVNIQNTNIKYLITHFKEQNIIFNIYVCIRKPINPTKEL
jgi:hypothetical protein